jgi:hypothetical protein
LKDLQPNEITRTDLGVHAVRYGLADGFDTSVA